MATGVATSAEPVAPVPSRTAAIRRYAAYALLLAVIVVGAAIVVDGTSDGIGERHDTSHYLSAATNLRNGDGLTVAFSSAFDPIDTETALDHYGRAPLTHYPPGYPAAIASVDLVTPAGIEGAARLIGVLSVIVVALSAYVLAMTLGASPLAAAGIAGVATLTPSLLHLSMWAMSDSPAAALTLATLAAASASLRCEGRGRAQLELVAGFLGAATTATRYNGIAAMASAVVIVVIGRTIGERATRLWGRETGLAVARVAGPVIVLNGAIATYVATRRTGPRPVAWHPKFGDDIRSLYDVVGLWAVGSRHLDAMRIASAVFLAFGVIVVAAVLLRRRAAHLRFMVPGTAVAIGLIVYAIAQLAVVFVTSALLDADVTADRRILIAVEILVLVALGVCVARLAPLPVAMVLFAACIAFRLSMPTGAFPEGIDEPDMTEPTPMLYSLVDDLPSDIVIATNNPEGIWRDNRRASIVAPARLDKLSNRTTEDFPGRVVEMGRLVGERGGVLVLEEPRLFGQVVDSPRVLSPSEVTTLLPCASIWFEAAEGYIYDLSACASG